MLKKYVIDTIMRWSFAIIWMLLYILWDSEAAILALLLLIAMNTMKILDRQRNSNEMD